MTERRLYQASSVRPSAPPPTAAGSATAAHSSVSTDLSRPRRHDRQSRLRLLREKWWAVLLICFLLVGIGVLTYNYIATRNELNRLSRSNQAVSAQQLTEEISKHLLLPDERPTLATVSDTEKLKGQEFFKNAENGDKVLIFPKAGRALIYRPSTDQVIEYAKVNLSIPQH